MNLTVLHYKTDTVADGTNANLVRPSDWNSTHYLSGNLIDGISLSGNNTLGVMTPISSGTAYWAGSQNVSLSQNANSLTIVGPDLSTYMQKGAQLIRVSPSGADFTDPKQAVDSISDNSSTKQYVVLVGPGTYTTAPTTMKAYVSVISEGGYYSTRWITNDNANHFITGAANSEIIGIALVGPTGAAKACIYHTATGSAPFHVISCAIVTGTYGVWCYNATTRSRVHLVGTINLGTPSTMTNFLYVSGFGNAVGINCWVMSGAGNIVTNAFNVDGANAEMTLDMCGARATAANGVVVFDATNVRITGSTFTSNGTRGIAATGAAIVKVIASTVLASGQWCLYTANSAYIFFNGETDKAKISINDASTIPFGFIDDTPGQEGFVAQNIMISNTATSYNITDGLTYYAQASHSHGNLALTGLLGTSASNGLSLSKLDNDMAFSAGTNQATSGTIVFANSNGVSFGMDTNGIVTATVQPGAAAGIAAIGDSASTQTNGTLAFANSNGVSFGLNGSTMTASINPSAGGAALKGSGTYSQNTGTVEFANSNGITFGLSNNGTMTASHNGLVGATVFSNSNNITFGLNGSTITASATVTQSTAPAGIAGSGASTLTNGTLQFANGNNVSFGLNGSTMTASIPTPLAATVFSNSNNVTFGLNGSTVTASATFNQTAQTFVAGVAGSGASTVTNGTIQFANANGLSFGLNGSTMTGSHNGLTGATVFSNSNNVTFGLNGSTVTASATMTQSTAPAGIAGSGASTLTNGTIQFANGNNVSFGLNGSTMTASIPTPLAATVFSNSNNVTFGLNGSTVTASATFNQTAQTFVAGIAGSAASTVTNGTIQFSNLNNVSFGLNGSTMTASIPAGATATGNLSGVAGSAASTVTGGVVQFANLNGVSFGLNGSTMTASHNGLTVATVFSNSNNVTFGLNGATVTASVTVAQTVQTFVGGVAGSAASTVTNGTVQFANLNGISFGLNGSTMTADYSSARFALTANDSLSAVSSVASRVVGIAGSNASTASGNVQFANGNNVTFGLNGSTITASASFNQTAQTFVAGIAGSGASTVTNGTMQFANANGISFGLNGSTMTASHVDEYVNGWSLAGANTAGTNVTLMTTENYMFFSGGNNITLSGNSNTLIISAGAGGGGVAVADSGASTVTSGTLQFANSNGVTFGLNGSTMTCSVQAGAAAGIGAVGIGASSVTSGTLAFANANGISFGFNGSTITGSKEADSYMYGWELEGNNTAGSTSWSNTTEAPIYLSAGANMVLSGNSNTLIISASNQGITRSQVYPYDLGGMVTGSGLGQNSLYFVPFEIKEDMYAHRIIFFHSLSVVAPAGASTGSGGRTFSAAIYARELAQTDRITSFWSGSNYIRFNVSSNTNVSCTYATGIAASDSVGYSSYGQNNATAGTQVSSSVQGLRPILIPISSSFTAGQYWLAVAMSTVTGATMTMLHSIHQLTKGSQDGFQHMNIVSSASNAGFIGPNQGFGTYSAVSAAFPGSVSLTTNQIRNQPTGIIPAFCFSGWTTNANQL